MNQYILEQYNLWLEKAVSDKDLIEELQKNFDNEEEIEDAFYQNLSFGTGGLRGIIGAGTNRMNVYTVAKASQGLANYIIKQFGPKERKIAVSYDSRVKSNLFAKVVSGVFAENGIKVFIYDVLMPTPCLSFAVREMSCAAGVMITASHNPSKYNGYKVYGADGCQITTKTVSEIYEEIEMLDIFEDVKIMDFNHGLSTGIIQYIPEYITTAFIETVKNQSVLNDAVIDKNVAIIYTPLNGTGLKPVVRTLKECGYMNITLVSEQQEPDGNFPTCPFPNPEIKETMALGIKYAKNNNADLLLATDPDCDRIGIAVKDTNGKYVLLSGNETGILLFDYICAQRIAHGTMPPNPVMIKTIVTTDLGEKIAAHYDVRTINVLTGFKFIGEQIGILESNNINSFIFGFEESYGYLSGTYVRDKDAVGTSLLICEMFAYYASKGICLLDKLNELYEIYGYNLNTLHSYEFEGSFGLAKIQRLMRHFRENIYEFGGMKVIQVLDYASGVDGLPKADVLKFLLEDNCSLVVRPSGTEPKLKVYISINAKNREIAKKQELRIITDIHELIE